MSGSQRSADPDRRLRVALVGNMGNNAYRVAKWMRGMGWPATLWMLPHDKTERSLPESVDRELAGSPPGGGYPEWIRRYRSLDQGWLPRANEDARAIEEDVDVVVTTGPGIRAAPHFVRRPVVHMSLGGDVNEMPWNLYKPGLTRRHRKDALMARLGLRHARSILSGFEPDFVSLRRLGLSAKAGLWGFPDDVVGNREKVDRALLDELTGRYAGHDRVLLWLTRLNYLDTDAPDYKGVERFARAARRLIVDQGKNLRLVFGDHGRDREAFRSLITELGLDPHVDWVPHLPYWKLLTWLSIPNAIVGDEIVPHMGEISGMARESLTVGAVVLKSVDRPLLNASFTEGYPMPSAHDEGSTLRALTELCDLPLDRFRAIGDAGHAWASEHMHYEPQIHRLVHRLHEALYLDALSGDAADRKIPRPRAGDFFPLRPGPLRGSAPAPSA